MPRRIVAFVLVLAVLGYGTAWAYGGHAVDLGVDVSVGAHEHPQAASDDGDCDHCCHVAAHMVGLSSPPPALFRPDGDRFPVAADRAASAMIPDPPLKPPRA